MMARDGPGGAQARDAGPGARANPGQGPGLGAQGPRPRARTRVGACRGLGPRARGQGARGPGLGPRWAQCPGPGPGPGARDGSGPGAHNGPYGPVIRSPGPGPRGPRPGPFPFHPFSIFLPLFSHLFSIPLLDPQGEKIHDEDKDKLSGALVDATPGLELPGGHIAPQQPAAICDSVEPNPETVAKSHSVEPNPETVAKSQRLRALVPRISPSDEVDEMLLYAKGVQELWLVYKYFGGWCQGPGPRPGVGVLVSLF